jgi:hypothetical protein
MVHSVNELLNSRSFNGKPKAPACLSVRRRLRLAVKQTERFHSSVFRLHMACPLDCGDLTPLSPSFSRKESRVKSPQSKVLQSGSTGTFKILDRFPFQWAHRLHLHEWEMNGKKD